MDDREVVICLPDNGVMHEVRIPYSIFSNKKTYEFFRRMIDLFGADIVKPTAPDYQI